MTNPNKNYSHDLQLKIIIHILAILPILIGFLNLLGWLFNISLLKSIRDEWVPMPLMSAICFILLGAALLSAFKKKTVWISYGLSFIVGIIGLFILAEYVLSFVNYSIDSRLIQMAFLSAINFVLISIAFIGLLYSEKKIWPQILLFISFISPSLTLLNYLYSVKMPYSVEIYKIVSFESTISFIIIISGMLLHSRESGIMPIFFSKGPGGILTRRIVPALILIQIVMGYFRVLGEKHALYNMQFGTSLLITAIIFCFTPVIAAIAVKIDKMNNILLENKKDLALALKSAQAGTWHWNLITNKITPGDRCKELFGFKEGESYENLEDYFKKIHPDDIEQIKTAINKSINEKVEFVVDYRVIIPNKENHVFGSRGLVYHSAQGIPERLTGIVVDITEQKQKEIELREAKILAEKLNKEAQAADRAKSAFLAAMSHEIRTPLNGVIGMINLLTDSGLSSEQKEYLKIIKLSGDSLLNVINDILDYSKIESGFFEIEKIDFNLQKIVEESIDMFALKAYEKGLAIGCIISPQIPTWMNGDPTRIRQVLINLLNNALKFTEQGEIVLHVFLDSHDKEKNSYIIRFELVDTGVGISKEEIKHLFKLFTQADNSTSRKYGGTGLGLAITKLIVECFGGNIGVESEVKKGSKFWFTLNLARATLEHDNHTYDLIPKLAGLHVLIVDDNSVNCQIALEQTQAWKMRSEAVGNGNDALTQLLVAAAKNDPYQLALIDYDMPFMSGLELAKKIHETPEIANTPVIIMTSFGEHISTEKLKEIDVFNYLTKPVKQSVLYNVIISLLDITPSKVFKTEVKNNLNYDSYDGKILIAEDHIVNQKVIKNLLGKFGLDKIHITNNGVETVAEFEKKSYDLIFMDCEMPTMDGYRATRLIRKIETEKKLQPIPIIAMTAHALKGDREKCIEAGMDDYISKPIEMDELSRVLKEWLKAKNSFSEDMDIDRLNQITGSNHHSLLNFLDIFIHSVEPDLFEVHKAILARNRDLGCQYAHQLKGACGNSGAKKMHELAIALEKAIREKNWSIAEQLLKDEQEAFQIVKAFYNSECEKNEK